MSERKQEVRIERERKEGITRNENGSKRRRIYG